MVAAEGEFPKTDGEILYAKDANILLYDALNSGTMNYAAVTVGTSATVIKAANADRKVILINNNSTQNMWIGDSGVTIADGQKLKVGESIKLYTQSAIYGIAASSADDSRYLEVE